MDELSYVLAGYQRRNWAVLDGLLKNYVQRLWDEEKDGVLIATQTATAVPLQLVPAVDFLSSELMMPEPPEDENVMYCKRFGREVRYEWQR